MKKRKRISRGALGKLGDSLRKFDRDLAKYLKTGKGKYLK